MPFSPDRRWRGLNYLDLRAGLRRGRLHLFTFNFTFQIGGNRGSAATLHHFVNERATIQTDIASPMV